jgi:DNA-binding response OmpR family regulator
MRIAILDQDSSQVQLICQALGAAGHVCDGFLQGKELLLQLRKESYDMLIFAWPVADMDGAEVILRAREKMSPGAPVAFLASYAAADDIHAGLDAGANDYLLKPLRRGDIVTRAQALLRRAYPVRPDQANAAHIEFGRYAFDIGLGRVLVAGSALELTQKEFSLALLFFRNLGRPLSRTYIHDEIWVRDSAMASRTLDTHVSRVRNKLHLTPAHGYRLAPVYSYGYRLEQLALPAQA